MKRSPNTRTASSGKPAEKAQKKNAEPARRTGQRPSPERKASSPFTRYVSSEPSGQSQKFIKNSRYFTICIYGLVMILVSAVIFKAVIDIHTTKAMFAQLFAILGPFIFGALLAYILNPMVHMFYRFFGRIADRLHVRLNHTAHTILSILITYLIIFGCILLALFYFVPELISNLVDFANSVPQIYNAVLDLLDLLQERFPDADIEGMTKPLTDALPDLMTSVRDMAANIVPAVYSLSMSLASWIVNLLITIIVSIYILYDKRQMMRTCMRIIYAFLPKKHVPACREILSECNRLFSSFVVGQFIDSVMVGILCFLLMTILRLEYAPLISFIVGVTNMIPYFGPFIGAIPGVLILLFIRPVHAIVFAVMILCLQQFDGLILCPKILGSSTGVKPLWIVFAISIGGSLAGVIGMFLGVPVIAILRYLLDSYLQYRLDKKHVSEFQLNEALRNLDLDD